MIYPVKTGYACYVTQGYGLTSFARSSTGKAAYKNFPGGIHPGVDFGTKGVAAPVISLVRGKVVRASNDGGWGLHVEILAEDGWNRQYCHLSKAMVVVGQEVAPFDVLGLVGKSGFSTGVHLHYGKRRKKLLGGWEYADPSADFENKKPKPTPAQKPPALPATRLVKGPKTSEVFVLSKKKTVKHHVPDWETLTYLFGSAPEIGEADQALLDKIPLGEPIPSLNA